MCPCSGFRGPGLAKIIVFFLPGYLFREKVLTSGSSRDLMKEQALAAFRLIAAVMWWV